MNCKSLTPSPLPASGRKCIFNVPKWMLLESLPRCLHVGIHPCIWHIKHREWALPQWPLRLLPPTFLLTNLARVTPPPYSASYQEMSLLFRRDSTGMHSELGESGAEKKRRFEAWLPELTRSGKRFTNRPVYFYKIDVQPCFCSIKSPWVKEHIFKISCRGHHHTTYPHPQTWQKMNSPRLSLRKTSTICM